MIGAIRSIRQPHPDSSIQFLEALESTEDLTDSDMVKLLQQLAEDDPIRRFLQQGDEGHLNPKESAELAARLAEVSYFLTIKRREQEKFIYLPHVTKRREFQDSQLNQINLYLWEFATAAQRGIEIRWR